MNLEANHDEGMTEQEKIKNGICPVCDSSLVFQEGCAICFRCGWGGCSG